MNLGLVKEMGLSDTGQEKIHCWPRDESVSWPGNGSGIWSGKWIRHRLGDHSGAGHEKDQSAGQETDQKAGQGNGPDRHRPGDVPLLAKR